ncbi:large ribosomal subunit protein mL101 (rPPR4)-like isoform X2 [Tasmannia lanceolata]|uniref:large ribosomal subunit protein mL101 (rPPR4)-like isoform X2 n=1 Tax=Tasmannia lanceolata TaxID=3420 RepID=UPI004062A7CF
MAKKSSSWAFSLLFELATTRRECSTMAKTSGTKKRVSEDSLYRRLSPLGGMRDGSVDKVLDQWQEEGKYLDKYYIVGCINQLRKFKRFRNAVLVSEWMEKRDFNFTYSDHAIRVDLISKAKGIDSAEKYFESLPVPAKNKFTYGALLNCYCKEKMSEKAMSLFDTMSKLNFASTPIAYNNIMCLYMRLGHPERVPPLVQEMKVKNIPFDNVTYNVLMNSYASLKDIEAVERVMEEVERGDAVKRHWNQYSNLAGIYIAAGLFEKAESTLKELEKMNNPPDRTIFDYLISLYAGTGNLAAVNRVWKSLKLAFSETTDKNYLTMLHALAKLDDMDGMKKCFEEWEAGCSSYDMRLVYVLINAFNRLGMIDEAYSLFERTVKNGHIPSFRTLNMLMDFYLKNQLMVMALKCMEIAISKLKKDEWRPSQENVRAFLKYFEEEKDVNGAEEFCKKLKKVNCLDLEGYNSLLRTYVASGKTDPLMRQRMKVDVVEMGSETEKLLERVCPS